MYKRPSSNWRRNMIVRIDAQARRRLMEETYERIEYMRANWLFRSTDKEQVAGLKDAAVKLESTILLRGAHFETVHALLKLEQEFRDILKGQEELKEYFSTLEEMKESLSNMITRE